MAGGIVCPDGEFVSLGFVAGAVVRTLLHARRPLSAAELGGCVYDACRKEPKDQVNSIRGLVYKTNKTLDGHGVWIENVASSPGGSGVLAQYVLMEAQGKDA